MAAEPAFIDTNVLVYASQGGTAQIDLLEQYLTGGRQVHDANIVATMLVYGVRRLLTFNGRSFRSFGGMITVEAGWSAVPRTGVLGCKARPQAMRKLDSVHYSDQSRSSSGGSFNL